MLTVPYTRVHPRTRAALARCSRHTVYRQLAGDLGYVELLSRLWAACEALVIVEHDIEIHEQVLPGFEECPEPWCTFPFGRLLPGPHSRWDGAGWGPGIPLLEASLGCVRWSAALMEAEPDLMTEVAAFSVDGKPPGHWQSLDCAIAVILRQRGYAVHVHHPEVLHHHYLERWERCSCGDEACA